MSLLATKPVDYLGEVVHELVEDFLLVRRDQAREVVEFVFCQLEVGQNGFKK